jgi:spore maturation protein CgeB
MRIVMFYHSLVSDWNHGNAHFLRGIANELTQRGHDVRVFEPADSWSLKNLLRERGVSAIGAFRDAYPALQSTLYDPNELDLSRMLDGAGLVLVHAWNTPALVAQIGAYRARARGFSLLFHDTYYRSASVSTSGANDSGVNQHRPRFDLRYYDGVLAAGHALRDRYLEQSRTQRAWVWHEAADTRIFRPLGLAPACDDLIWVGSWGEGERSRQLQDLLLGPIAELELEACLYGERYPEEALTAIAAAGARYRGFVSNFDVPSVFARHKVTVHVPRLPAGETPSDDEAPRGIPSIRVFEALACGIPLVSAPWADEEGLFSAGEDYLVARDAAEMTKQLRAVINDRELADSIAAHGLATVRRRHTCAHRVDELFQICRELKGNTFDLAPSNTVRARRPGRPSRVNTPRLLRQELHVPVRRATRGGALPS